MDIYDYIINKNPDNKFYTGIVSNVDPLQVKIYPLDDAINCKATTGLYGLKVGSNVVLMKIGNQFLIVNVIGKQINTYMDSIMINRNSTQTITTTDATKVQFNNEKVVVGDKLSFDNVNYGVKIGSGIKTVKVCLQLWIERVDTSYSYIFIYKNSTSYASSIHTKLSGFERWVSLSCNALINVVENDLIYGYVDFSVADSTYNVVAGGYVGSCNLIVEAIELG